MALFETESLILRNYNLSDADKIVVFLTKNEGIVKGVAKGAKRLKSKFSGGLEQFSIVNLTYFQKDQQELVSIRQIDLERSFFEKTSQVEFLQKFNYIAKLLIDFVPPHDPNERLYKMSKVCLETASENPENLESIILYFELWLLRLGGYLPSWDKCNGCKKDFSPFENTHLQHDFHVVCNDCQKSKRNLIITPTQRNFFSNAQKVSPNKFVEMTSTNKKELLEVSAILKRLISQILGREIIGEKILTANF